MFWIVKFLQLAGPVYGTLVFVWDVYHPVRAYRAGDIVASWDGFYLPLLVNLATCLLSFSLTFIAPQWRFLLLWVRERLPDVSRNTRTLDLLNLIEAAFKEQEQNGLKTARNLLAQLDGRTERESVEKSALEKLQQELQRILQELRGVN